MEVNNLVELRILNDRGVDAFRNYLTDSASLGAPEPRHLLSDNNFSKPFIPTIYLQRSKVFNSKSELAEYLIETFDRAGLTRQVSIRNRNLWASIVLFYFDQFCPISDDGKRDVKMEKNDKVEQYPKYIPRLNHGFGEESLRGRRHLALTPYLIYEYNKHTSHKADVLLSGKIYSFGDDVEQTAGRIEVISNRSLIELIRMLYWDEENRKLLRGYSTKSNPGNINRLVADLRNQMKLTTDWYSMPAQEIYDNLPPEYDYWKDKKSP